MTSTTDLDHTATPARGDATLTEVLDAELRFSPSIHGVYSNHLAMELVALHQLHAEPDVLQHVFDDHGRHGSEPRDDVADLEAVRRQVVGGGIVDTVRSWIPRLAHAPSTALFHPAIRLAYALDVGHGGQVAAALLDWQRRLQPLPRADELKTRRNDRGGPSRRLADVAAELTWAAGGRWARTFDLDGVARRPEVVDAMRDLTLDEHTLDDVSSFALAAHVAADDFLTLHLVTGARAVRAIAAVVDADTAQVLVVHTARAMAVVHAAIGAPALLDEDALARRRGSGLPSDEAIAAAAIADLDPHVVKLANVAIVEAARSGDPLYRYVAARVVGLVAETGAASVVAAHE